MLKKISKILYICPMKHTHLLLLIGLLLSVSSCKKKKNEETPAPTPTSPTSPGIETTVGYNLLGKITGIWNGPVTSTTPLGGYPEWIVDFRPISAGQVSAKNELDSLNDIFMSFFIAKYNGEYRLAFRNGGSFGGSKRVSYFLADSVSETSSKSFYRFAEILKGKDRAYTEVIFSNDSLYIKSYTNNYNTQPTSTPHMAWSAKLQDTSSTQNAITNFNYPHYSLVKDFTNSFTGQTEAVYFSTTGDPYPESDQPYLGRSVISYSFGGGYTPVAGTKVFLILTTQPLISGFTINTANLKTRSRYVILDSGDLSYTFNYMHPGTYYLYALYDADGNNNFSSGDWVSVTNTSFTLAPTGVTSASTVINFTIP